MARSLMLLFRWLLCLVLCGLFLAAAVHKIAYPEEFAKAVFRYQMLPDGLINLAALYLPWLELICALTLLLYPRFRAAALVIILLLLIVFTGAQIANLIRGIDGTCGCLTTSETGKPISWMSIALNGGFIVANSVALWLDAVLRRPMADTGG